MSQASQPKCTVCGFFVGEDGLCERCGTVITGKKVLCQSCGNPFPAFSFVCEYCGKSVNEAKREKEEAEETSLQREEAVKRFQLVPGVTEEMASNLFEEGVTDFASLIALTLTKRQKEKGLHHIIARRIMLMDVLGTKKKKVASEVVECPTCKSLVDASSKKCVVCGYCTMIGLDENVQKLEKNLGKCIGEAYNKIHQDKGFREMPVSMQREITEMLRENEVSYSITRDCEDQLQSWEEGGFDVDELERMLKSDFVTRGKNKPQTPKKESPKPEKGRVSCPLCQSGLDPGSPSCDNCGAKFKRG
ncbi:MAG: hypothetical protein E3J35_08380 [Methanomassiliicoccales archaeon]|nr:MAG: hypothetical protein E3J35_08380 [Methanomassiliicoccales archaeon]